MADFRHVAAHIRCWGQAFQVKYFLDEIARYGDGHATVNEDDAWQCLQVARPSSCLREPAGRDLPRDMPCTMPRALRSHGSLCRVVVGLST